MAFRVYIYYNDNNGIACTYYYNDNNNNMIYVFLESNMTRIVIRYEIYNALHCLRTLVPPKGRGGMHFGRLKYIIKKVWFRYQSSFPTFEAMKPISAQH
jgi:hypothetical protein